MEANLCASDTSASGNCDASGNPPLPVGDYTVDWQVVRQYVGPIADKTSFSLAVRQSCIPGKYKHKHEKQQSQGALNIFFDTGILDITLIVNNVRYAYTTGSGSYPGTGIPPEDGKEWYLPPLPAHKAYTTEQHYELCCRPVVILPPRELVTKADAKKWGSGKYQIKTKFSIDPGYWADVNGIAECKSEMIWTIPTFTWESVQAKMPRTVFSDKATCIKWTPTEEDKGKIFVPQCGVSPVGGWQQGDRVKGNGGVDDLSAMYPRIHIGEKPKMQMTPEMKKKISAQSTQ